MFENRDYEIMQNSEVFREFLKVKQARDREAAEMQKIKDIEDEDKETDNLEEALDDFNKFEDYIVTHPDAKDRLLKIKHLLEENTELREKVDPDFVRGIFMIQFGDEENTTYPDAMDRLKAISAKILED